MKQGILDEFLILCTSSTPCTEKISIVCRIRVQLEHLQQWRPFLGASDVPPQLAGHAHAEKTEQNEREADQSHIRGPNLILKHVEACKCFVCW